LAVNASAGRETFWSSRATDVAFQPPPQPTIDRRKTLRDSYFTLQPDCARYIHISTHFHSKCPTPHTLPRMSGKAGAYGTQGGGDTDFRKTWDREEMAKKARERETKEREEGKERYEAKAAGKSYRRRASTPEDLKQTEARSERIDWSQMIGKQTLTSAAAGVGKRGKGAGAYCQACDLTFK
jgi:hypothetical protein